MLQLIYFLLTLELWISGIHQSKRFGTHFVLELSAGFLILLQLVTLCPKLIHLIALGGNDASLRFLIPGQRRYLLALVHGFSVRHGFPDNYTIRHGGMHRPMENGMLTMHDILRDVPQIGRSLLMMLSAAPLRLFRRIKSVNFRRGLQTHLPPDAPPS